MKAPVLQKTSSPLFRSAHVAQLADSNECDQTFFTPGYLLILKIK